LKHQPNREESFSDAAAFLTFKAEISSQRRYLRSAEGDRFLSAVAATCRGRLREIPAGEIFWRAQVGHEWVLDTSVGRRVRSPHSETRMKPLPDRAYEGRVNPKGIPSLYFATTRDVAMSEVRPWVGSVVSVARFRTTRGLTVVDCSVLHGAALPSPEAAEGIDVEEAVWAHIDHAFSRPVTRSDNTAEYAATQVLAELFRQERYDGIIYKSAFSAEGLNLALFDLEAARQVDSALFEVRSAKFDFQEVE
jgi:RES domain-containing protein